MRPFLLEVVCKSFTLSSFHMVFSCCVVCYTQWFYLLALEEILSFKRHPMNQIKDKTWAYFFSVVSAEGKNVLHCDGPFECHF